MSERRVLKQRRRRRAATRAVNGGVRRLPRRERWSRPPGVLTVSLRRTKPNSVNLTQIQTDYATAAVCASVVSLFLDRMINESLSLKALVLSSCICPWRVELLTVSSKSLFCTALRTVLFKS